MDDFDQKNLVRIREDLTVCIEGLVRVLGMFKGHSRPAPNEQHIHSLLLNHKRLADGRVCYAGSPLRSGGSEIQTINQRIEMLVTLARYEDPEGEMSAEELQAHTRTIASRYATICSAYESAREAMNQSSNDRKLRQTFARAQMEYEFSEAAGWEWASSVSIAEYTGGTFGDDGASVQLPGLIEWRSMKDGGPLAIKYAVHCCKPVNGGRVCSKAPGHAGACGLTPFG